MSLLAITVQRWGWSADSLSFLLTQSMAAESLYPGKEDGPGIGKCRQEVVPAGKKRREIARWFKRAHLDAANCCHPHVQEDAIEHRHWDELVERRSELAKQFTSASCPGVPFGLQPQHPASKPTQVCSFVALCACPILLNLHISQMR